MPWGAAVGAGIGLLGDAMSEDKNGGAGSQSSSKEPWAPLQPWLLTNALQGIEMQGRYQAQPFSPQQQAAYDNSYAQSDYMRDLVPSLLGQMQQQPVGFDPANPLARPKAWDWNAMGGGSGGGLGQRSILDAAPPPGAAPQKEENPLGAFLQQNDAMSGMNMSSFDGQTMLGSGGYGSFKYGMDVKPGTQAYRDMSEYFAMGGLDPNDKYGRGAQYQNPNATRRSLLLGGYGLFGGSPGEGEGPSSGAPGGAASAGPAGTF